MPKDFTKNMRIAFEGRTTPTIVNNKLLQLRFLHMVSKFKKEEIHEYMTDLIFLCQKIERERVLVSFLLCSANFISINSLVSSDLLMELV